jgi:hypothetical protein
MPLRLSEATSESSVAAAAHAMRGALRCLHRFARLARALAVRSRMSKLTPLSAALVDVALGVVGGVIGFFAARALTNKAAAEPVRQVIEAKGAPKAIGPYRCGAALARARGRKRQSEGASARAVTECAWVRRSS